MAFKVEKTIPQTTRADSEKGLAELLQTEIVLGKRFSNKKKEAFYSELSVLLKAGIHLRESLELLLGNQTKEKQRQFYKELVDALVAGKSFAETIKTQPDISEYEYYSLKIGEETGTLAKITAELAEYYAVKNEQRRTLMNALSYPIIILCTAILVVTFMLRMVVPMFEDIFRQNGVDLPPITKMIISASNVLQEYGGLFLLVLLLPFLFKRFQKQYPGLKRTKDYLMLRIPFLGAFLRSVYLAQFTQAVALLTTSKVPVLNSLKMVGRMIAFAPLQEALKAVEGEVLQGKNLHQSLKDKPIFDSRMVSLVKVAEETNQTEFIFQKLNKQYAQEVQQKSKMLTTLMEPLIIVVIGIFVGVILISMYLPMFKLSTVLG